ncbi:hypothetical protein As57867_006271, partial [Aphanomyces stellatus]
SHSLQQHVETDISVGKPIPNVNCYVLDDQQRPVPVGVPGEFYIGGIGVSPGYLNLSEETSAKFIPDIFLGHGCMYRSGDFGRILPNGNFEIIGRRDNQVKLKGYRIELDEVGTAMMQHPQVISAAAIVKDKSHLVGYFTPPDVSIDSLTDFVAAQLPVYMVPAIWVGLDTMPLNTNGKIDKNVLMSMDVNTEVEALSTSVEKQLATVWANVLDVSVSSIGRQTSFFALGGDSLTVIKVVAACKKVGLHITAAQLLKEMLLWRVASMAGEKIDIAWPQVSLAHNIVQTIEKEWAASLKLDKYLVYPVTALQAGMVYATINDREAYVLQRPFEIPDVKFGENIVLAFETIVKRHDILRTTFVTSSSGVYQIVRDNTLDLELANVTATTITEFLNADRERGFEIGDKYFVRWSTVATNSRSFGVLTIHHGLYDGWTLSMLINDLMDVLQNKALIERPSFHRVVDYIEAQDKFITETFWREYLSDLTPSTMVLFLS